MRLFKTLPLLAFASVAGNKKPNAEKTLIKAAPYLINGGVASFSTVAGARALRRGDLDTARFYGTAAGATSSFLVQDLRIAYCPPAKVANTKPTPGNAFADKALDALCWVPKT